MQSPDDPVSPNMDKSLFKQYQVGVGISLDGPAPLNDARWGDTLTHRTVLLDSAVHWSARHGIAELKTPLFRLTTDVAATAGTYQLALEGHVQPEDAATGGVFPYCSPRKRAVTGQASWQ